jgi:hypothetical protein
VEDIARQSIEQVILQRRKLDRIRTRAESVTRYEFLKVLAKVPDAEPDEHDRI